MKSAIGQLIRLRGVNEDQILGQEDPEFAADIQNMEFHREGYWTPTTGVTATSATFTGSTIVWEMTFFRLSTGAVRLVVEHGTLTSAMSTLTWWHPGGAAQVDITTTRRRSGGYWRRQPWLQAGRWLYHFNGLQQAIRWDGDRTAPVGWVTPPSAPVVAQVTEDQVGFFDYAASNVFAANYNFKRLQRGVGEYAGSGTAPWTYAYGVTVISDNGQESPMSSLSWARGENETTLGRRMVRLRGLRQDDHIRAVRLWRSLNLYGVDGPTGTLPDMYLLREINTGGEWDLFDDAPDAELGIAFDSDTVGCIPLGAHSPAMWQNTLFLAVKDRVVFSYPGLIEQFPATHYLPLPKTTMGEISALHVIASGVLVFSERGVCIVKGDPLNGFRLEVLSDRVGTTAPAAIVSVPNQGTFFLSSEAGPQRIRGTLEQEQPTFIEPVPGLGKTWKREYQGANLTTAVGLWRPEVDEVWWQLPTFGDWLPTRGHVLHLGIGGWSTRPNAAWVSALPGGMLSGKTSAGAGGRIWTIGGTGTTPGGDTITGIYECAVMSSSWPRTLQRVEVTCIGMGDLDVAVDLKLDRAVSWTAISSGRPMLHPKDDLPERAGELLINQPPRTPREVWRAAGYTGADSQWSASRVWFDYEPTMIPVSIGQGRAHEHQVRLSTTAGRIAAITPRWNPKDGDGPPRSERL